MCVVSMIMDHYDEKWSKMTWTSNDMFPQPKLEEPYVLPTKEEVEEFRQLLERAREYDRRNNEPDCELETKKQKVKDLADKLGLNIDFL